MLRWRVRAGDGMKSLELRAVDRLEGAIERGEACCRPWVRRAVVRTADFMVDVS